MEDLISVIMGVKYQRESTALLERAVQSILDQTYSNIEFLICERDSTEGAKEYLYNIERSNKIVKIIDGSMAKSFSEQLNMCLREAKGSWIARMDDDDYSHTDRFKKQLEYLKSNSDISFVGCNAELFLDGKKIGTRHFPEEPEVKDFLFSMPFIHPAIIFKSSALKAVNGYSEKNRCERCEDYDLLLRMYEKGMRGANIQMELFSYSLPPKGIDTRSFRDRVNETRTRIVRFKSLGILPRNLHYALKPIAVWLIPKKLLAKIKEFHMHMQQKQY